MTPTEDDKKAAEEYANPGRVDIVNANPPGKQRIEQSMRDFLAGVDHARAKHEPSGEWGPLVERLAAIEHDQWRTWARHLLFHADGEPNISDKRKKRWEELINLDYDELPDDWQEFDREWARRSVGVIEPEITRLKADLDKAVGALEFYADQNNFPLEMDRDNGINARCVLAELRRKE